MKKYYEEGKYNASFDRSVDVMIQLLQKYGHHDLEIDHIIPISKGGKSTYDNLQTLCRRCNLEEGSKIE